jgi:hypothetical protein
MPEDPYADPVTRVLRNKLGSTTARELEDAEREITHAALVFLKEAAAQPAYDLGHLCAIRHPVTNLNRPALPLAGVQPQVSREPEADERDHDAENARRYPAGQRGTEPAAR